MMNSLNQVIGGAFERHSQLISASLEKIMPDVQRGAEMLSNLLEKGGHLFLCGNGGSAADSQHLAAEWVCKYKSDRRPLPAIALTTDSSIMTAVGNDYSFDEIFSRQIQALGSTGDVLVAFTTSGQSKNILKAIIQAKEMGLVVIVLTGSRGVALRKDVDLAIVVPSEETARIQEVHELIYHAWCEFLDSQR